MKWTLAQVLEQATIQKQVYDKRNLNIKEYRRLYNQEDEPFIPDEYRQVGQVFKTPYAPDLVQRIVPQMVPDDPRFRRYPLDASSTEETNNADDIERWAEGLHRGIIRRTGRDYVYMAAESAVRDGIGIIKVVVDESVWRDIPGWSEGKSYKNEEDDEVLAKRRRYKQTSDPPFLLFDIDPLTFYPVRTNAGIAAVFEIKQVPRQPLITKYGLKTSKSSSSWRSSADPNYNKAMWQVEGYDPMGTPAVTPEEMATVIEFWSGEQHMLIVDDKVVYDIDNPYEGYLPYFPFYGRSSSQREPENEGISAIKGLSGLVPGLNSLLTMKHQVAYSEAYPIHIKHYASKDLADADADPAPKVIVPGQFLKEVEGEEYRILDRPGASSDLREMVAEFKEMINLTGMADVLRGQSPGANSPGWLVSQLTDNAKAVFRPLRDNLNTAVSKAYEFILCMVDNVINEDVPLLSKRAGTSSGQRWVSIGPKEIDGYYGIEVELPAGAVSDKIMRGQFWAGMQQGGYVSRRRVQEEGLEIEHPEVEDRQILAEDLRKMLSPIALQVAFMRAGYEEIQQALVAEQIKQTGQLPEGLTEGGAQPPGLVGGMRVPGMGMATTPDMDSVGAAREAGPGQTQSNPTAAAAGLTRSRGPYRSGTSQPGGQRAEAPDFDY